MHDAILTLSLSASIGVVLVVAAQRLMLPAIVLLLIGGIVLGPEGLGLVRPDKLGHGLEIVASLAISVILFEGGLTLDLDGYRKSPVAIRRMLTIGPLITWLGTSAAVYFIFDTRPVMALMVASMVIVTGPTVVLPILRRLRVEERLHHVLYWEGVLIDVVGVFIAVMVYEWLTQRGDEEMPFIYAVGNFGMRVLLGSAMGAATGLILAWTLARNFVADDHVNIFALAGALFTFGVSHTILPESGILAVVVSGLVVALRAPPCLKQLKRFKLQLTEVGIGTIFILLAAKLKLESFGDPRLLIFLAALIFVLRPLVVWISTMGQGFGLQDKAFLSWIAPRGIVAASMASLFSLRLSESGYANADLIETITYATVIATVTIQGLSAPFVAKLLGVQREDRRTWVLLGNRAVIGALGSALRKGGVRTVEVDMQIGTNAFIDPNAPRFNDTHAMFFADLALSDDIWKSYNWGFEINAVQYYCWATNGAEPPSPPAENDTDRKCTPVWHAAVSSAVVAAGIASGRQSVEIIEIGGDLEKGRFGPDQLPLFWIDDGRATLIEDPMRPGLPKGNMVVVLRRRSLGLAKILSHVEVMDETALSLEHALNRLVASARRQYPTIPTETLIEGILERQAAMPVAVGRGVAIPHAYWDGTDESICFLGIAPKGISDAAPLDDEPVRLIFLLVSPAGKAAAHLESLSTISHLTEDPAFIDLLCRQRAPARIISLIAERG